MCVCVCVCDSVSELIMTMVLKDVGLSFGSAHTYTRTPTRALPLSHTPSFPSPFPGAAPLAGVSQSSSSLFSGLMLWRSMMSVPQTPGYWSFLRYKPSVCSLYASKGSHKWNARG